MTLNHREAMIEKNSGMWQNIPPDRYGKIWKVQQHHDDPIGFLEKPKTKYCKYTNRPITDNRKEIHPEHIAELGYCCYCGRLR